MTPFGTAFNRSRTIRRADTHDAEARSPVADRDPDESRTGVLGTLFSLSRRHDLPFGVLVVSATAPHHEAQPQLSARLAQWIDGETRQTDAVAFFGRDGAVVGCPATSPEGIQTLARRLRASAGDLPIRIGTASFRRDGLTLADLIAHASDRARGHRGGDDPPNPPRGPLRARPRSPRVPVISARSLSIKRFFDLFLVVAASPIWLIVLALAAAVLKISEPRAPVLFVQERTGLGGARFRFYKLRTMVTDAEQRKGELIAKNERSWPDFKVEDDPRITRIGRVLRATSLDELPQLWNVLRGDMSLVGPRPTSFPAETYQSWQTARLEVVPGLTGLWQVEARHCLDFSERIRIDLRYVRRRGFLYDLKILLRTVPVVLWHHEGR
jgi:lipopolysaccharide/colanic/teichoic acid biosynthesis glycosyltransferase